jgi:Protein of unknown function (DUF3349)
MMNNALREVLEQLRRAYPGGVPKDDYMALLAVLADDMSEENVAIVVAELIDGEIVAVANDAAATESVRVPAPAARARVRSVLESAGSHPDLDLPGELVASAVTASRSFELRTAVQSALGSGVPWAGRLLLAPPIAAQPALTYRCL